MMSVLTIALLLFLLSCQVASSTIVQVTASGQVEEKSTQSSATSSFSGRAPEKLPKQGLIRAHETLSTDLADCSESNTFSVNLLVTHHLHFLIVPTNEFSEVGCRPFLIHTLTAPGEENKKHAVSLPFGLRSLYEMGLDYDDESVDFGTHTLEDIMTAYSLAKVDAPGKEGELFDYTFNNCADFLTSFLSHLGHVSNPKETEIIAQLLLKNAEDLIPEFREATIGTDYAAVVSNMEDAELMYWLVESRLIGLYEEDVTSEQTTTSTL
mmetsp:Transcript_5857/g.8843  ORF Transcript_5857/g.8843 Transcript_5857/m.8843 type:complete len:267 (+) Transcript_5857:88-888(+)